MVWVNAGLLEAPLCFKTKNVIKVADFTVKQEAMLGGGEKLLFIVRAAGSEKISDVGGDFLNDEHTR